MGTRVSPPSGAEGRRADMAFEGLEGFVWCSAGLGRVG